MQAAGLVCREQIDAVVRTVAHVVLVLRPSPRGPLAVGTTGRRAVVVGGCGRGITAEITADVTLLAAGELITTTAIRDLIDTVVRVPQAEAVPHLVRGGVRSAPNGDLVQPETALLGERVRVPRESSHAEDRPPEAALLTRDVDVALGGGRLGIQILHLHDVVPPVVIERAVCRDARQVAVVVVPGSDQVELDIGTVGGIVGIHLGDGGIHRGLRHSPAAVVVPYHMDDDIDGLGSGCGGVTRGGIVARSFLRTAGQVGLFPRAPLGGLDFPDVLGAAPPLLARFEIFRIQEWILRVVVGTFHRPETFLGQRAAGSKQQNQTESSQPFHVSSCVFQYLSCPTGIMNETNRMILCLGSHLLWIALRTGAYRYHGDWT